MNYKTQEKTTFIFIGKNIISNIPKIQEWRHLNQQHSWLFGELDWVFFPFFFKNMGFYFIYIFKEWKKTSIFYCKIDSAFVCGWEESYIINLSNACQLNEWYNLKLNNWCKCIIIVHVKNEGLVNPSYLLAGIAIKLFSFFGNKVSIISN